MEKWVWQKENWTKFEWNEALVAVKLRLLHKKIGQLVGQSKASPDAESLPLEYVAHEFSSILFDRR